MSFSEQILKNKFDALEETQDSIVSTSQWVLFHYRYAERTAAEWERYLNSALISKKLPLIYLCNEVVQQSRAKRKTEFIEAFQKILPRALSKAYKEIPEALKKKVTKIINIWRERRIFPKPIDIDGTSSNGGSLEHKLDSNASFEDKLKAVSTTGQKFQRFYHEQLLASNGVFKSTDIKNLNSLKKAINDNIIRLQDLTETIENEVDEIHGREKDIEAKRKEVEARQKEIEEQRQREEAKRAEEEAKRVEEERIRKEEENMMPTYEEGSDSDSDSDSDAPKNKKDDSDDSDSEHETTERTEEPSKEAEEDTSDQPPMKKLRFAD